MNTKILVGIILLLTGKGQSYSQDFSVYFDTDSSELSEASRKLLDSICLSERYYIYALYGSADKRGTVNHNKLLIEKRINEVDRYLKEKCLIPSPQINHIKNIRIYDSLLPDHLNRRVLIYKWSPAVCYVAPPRTLILRFPLENFPHLDDTRIVNINNKYRDNNITINRGIQCYPCSEYSFDINGDADMKELPDWFLIGNHGDIDYRIPLADFEIIPRVNKYEDELTIMEYKGSPFRATATEPVTEVKKKKGFWVWVKRIFKKRKGK